MLSLGAVAVMASLVVVLIAFTPTLIEALRRGNAANPLVRTPAPDPSRPSR